MLTAIARAWGKRPTWHELDPIADKASVIALMVMRPSQAGPPWLGLARHVTCSAKCFRFRPAAKFLW